MDRRTYLVGLSTVCAVTLAGCADEVDDEEEPAEDEPADDDEEEPAEDEPADDDEEEPAEAEEGEDVTEVDGLVINEHEYVPPEDDFGSPTVEGIVENTRDEDLDYVEVRVRVYDEDGNQLDNYLTNTTDLAAGGTWAFEVMILDDDEDIDDYDIQVNDSPF